jgi:hypothetical protein
MIGSTDAYVVAWFKAFLFTAALEVPFVVWAYRNVAPRVPAPRRSVVALFAQLASHPLVWFVIPTLTTSYRATLVVAESWAVLSETVLYAAILGGGTRRAFAVALLANMLSFGLGLLLRATTGLL